MMTTSQTYLGRVVSVIGDEITIQRGNGREYHHTLARDAKVTIDGEASIPTDLVTGTKVRVTTHKDDDTLATDIDS